MGAGPNVTEMGPTMGSSKQLILSAILTYLAILPVPAQRAWGDEIRWHTDVAAALKEAGDKNRLVFLDVYKEICPPCQILDNVVYRDPAVIKFINENYVALKINGERETIGVKDGKIRVKDVDYANKISLYPTLMYVTADQQVLETQVGLIDAAGLLEQTKKMHIMLAAMQPKRPATPFQAGARLGPDTVRLHVWGNNQVFPPRSVGFSFEPVNALEERKQRAREILHQAVDSYRRQQWLSCLDLSRTLIVYYPDLPESSAAHQLEQNIGPDRFERLEKELTENLGQVYWELAQARIRQNQFAQAVAYMEKIVTSCPRTRYSYAAQEFLRSMNRGPAEQPIGYRRP